MFYQVTIPVGCEVIFVVNDGNGHVIVQGTDRAKPYDGEFRVDNLVEVDSFHMYFMMQGNIHTFPI